ncbi:GNAT family N-acetyltransferase [Kribbella antibiotica]|uniref:GNAT family N-acetyltransferase n=1 Tax=Kribbella antibiotica TaxID=190195 RepID=A0A4R4ZQD2_9ACTN|nr:GNAT family N-acetyltransferase [Kribbella antibiotica]TDD60089.1 GNAT family N-acetyltransferase [Kribbella antibiotica]
MPITLRAYSPEDAVPTWQVYYAAIRRTAIRDYTEKQVQAWAPDEVDHQAWADRRAAAHTYVVCVDDIVAGFSDFTDDGLLDMLFVHPDHSGQGIARMLVKKVQDEAGKRGLTRLVTHASRTARPAFESFGFVVDRENPTNQTRTGVIIPNYDMHYDL